MLFSEVYGSYFNVVADVISKAVEGNLDTSTIYDVVAEKAFGESALNIPKQLLNGNWRLMNEKLETPILEKPTMPLTTLQKRWLKSLLLDERIQLFAPSMDGLEDVEPLFTPDTVVYFDRYLDGDDYKSPIYQRNFENILTALKTKRKIKIKHKSGKSTYCELKGIPIRLEYSSKDDKFRVVVQKNSNRQVMINVGRIYKTFLLESYSDDELAFVQPKLETIVLELVDERNALERAMLHFSHFEKKTERLDEKHYRISLKYNKADETEILIRVLSFGPMLKAVSPKSFVDLLKERIEKQMSCEC